MDDVFSFCYLRSDRKRSKILVGKMLPILLCKEDSMEITEVRVQRVSPGNSLKAYANITFDDCFVLHNVRVIEGNDGLYIGMPSRKLSNGEFKNIAHPITAEFREKMTKAVLEVYEKTLVMSGQEAELHL